jgi:shikimate kinase
MPAVVIVGPSRVGKTTLAGPAAETIGVAYVDLDLAADARNPPFFERGAALLAECTASDSWNVVDVGAGFQDDPRGHAMLMPHSSRMISVMADAETVYIRHERPKDQFLQIEYRPERQRIYELARLTLRTSASIPDDQQRLCRMIEAIISDGA